MSRRHHPQQPQWTAVPEHLEGRRLFAADVLESSATAATTLDAGAVSVVAAPAQGATATEAAAGRWDAFVSESAASGGAIDPNALVQYVLRESYLATTEDLRFYAEKVSYFNACEALVRDHLSDPGAGEGASDASDESRASADDPD